MTAWAVLVFSAGWAAAEPPFPVETDSAESIVLRYAYRAGESVRYRLQIENSVTVSDITTGRVQSLSLSGSLQLSLVVQQLSDGGSMIVTEEVRDVDVEVAGDGLSVRGVNPARAISGVTRTVELSPRGEILDEEQQPGEVAEVLRLSGLPLGRMGEWLRIEFPEEAVTIGDSWVVEHSRPGNERTFDARQALTYTFLGWSVVEGRRCVALQVGGDGWQELGPEVTVGPLVGPALGRRIFHGYVYFDPAAGRQVRAEVEVGAVGQATGTSSPLDFVERANWTIELLD